MAKNGSYHLVMVILALADLGSACLFLPRFRIYSEVLGFDYEGYVIWSPQNCSNFVSRYGPIFDLGPITISFPPYKIDTPSGCPVNIALDYVSARIFTDAQSIFCQVCTGDWSNSEPGVDLRKAWHAHYMNYIWFANSIFDTFC